MAWNPEHLLAYENEMRAKRQAQSDAENRMYDEQRRAKQSAELAALRDRLAAAERDNARLRRSMQEAAAAIRCYDPRTMSKTALAWTADCLESIAALAEALMPWTRRKHWLPAGLLPRAGARGKGKGDGKGD